MSDTSPMEHTATLTEPREARPDYLEMLYSVLFHPVTAFESIAATMREGRLEGRWLFYAVMSVILISAMSPMIRYSATGGNVLNLLMLVPLMTVGGVMAWAFTALWVGLLSYAFTGETRIKLFLTLSGLATLPWLLMAPMILLKTGLGVFGTFVAVVAGLVIWLWTVLLFAIALIVTYRMTAERVMAVLAMPFLLSLVMIGWISGWIVNIAQLMPR